MTEQTATPAAADRSAAEHAGAECPTMRAVVQDGYGDEPDDVFRVASIDRPAIGDDEVLVRVHAAGLDRGTWHVMAGRPLLMRGMGFGFRRPKNPVPGLDVAGVVEQVGSSVTRFATGDEVFGIARGSFAEYAAAKEAKLARKPASLTFEQAAAVPVSASTALQAVRDAAQVEPGQCVLVIGASGGVGTYAVQLATRLGAEVTGVCSAAKADLVRSLGAHEVLDYRTQDFADGSRRYDVILDIAGNTPLPRLRRALTPRGALVVVGGEEGGRLTGGFGRSLRAPLLSVFVRQRLRMLVAKERAADLEALTPLLESGEIAPALDRTFPLGHVSAAMRHLMTGQVRGKIALTIESP
jgi:NADPH:quinone reductase-like Zn-dependent oxidoreductase